MRMGPGWRHCKTCREYCAQKDDYETDQTSNDIYIYIYGAETLATTKRLEYGIKVNERRMLGCV